MTGRNNFNAGKSTQNAFSGKFRQSSTNIGSHHQIRQIYPAPTPTTSTQ